MSKTSILCIIGTTKFDFIFSSEKYDYKRRVIIFFG